MLSLGELTVGYHGSRGPVLAPATLKVSDRSFICILGRNGAGKSTLMRTIAGLQPALGGYAALAGEDIAEMRPATRARRIAVVLTERSFSPGLKVEDVVSLGRQPFTTWQGHLTSKDWAIVENALERAGAALFRGRFFDDLSDGERQRVMIARAIAQTPRVMVLDEITAFLDLPGRVEIMALLRRHAHSTGTIVLLSSHDLDLSLQLADKVWLVADGRLQSAAAQEHVANGAISRAFDTADVTFSTKLGRFQLTPESRVAG